MIRSIQGRLNIAFIGLTLTIFAILWVIQGSTLRGIAYEFVGTRLSSDVFTLLQAIEREDGEWQLDTRRISPVYNQPMSGHYYQYQINEGDWVYSRSLWDEDIPTRDGFGVGQLHIALQMKNAEPWLVYDHTFQKQDGTVRIVLAEDVSSIEAELKRLGWWVGAVGVVFIAVLLLAQIFIIKRGLKSLTQVRQDIARLKQGDIRTLPCVETTEVSPLVDEINYMVDSMCMRLDRSRNAVGNLAHAAKTPLTVIDRQIEVLKQHSPNCAEALQQQSAELRGLMERELTRARIAGTALPGQRVMIDAEVEKLLKAMRMIHQEKGLQFEVDIKSKTFFPGERDDLIELLGNLIDNACKWAQSTVRISGVLSETCLTIFIEDDGPGIPSEKREQLLSRGERLDESVSGHGLGLSIVTDIVQQYQGCFELLDSDLGGLRVHLRLPRNRDTQLS